MKLPNHHLALYYCTIVCLLLAGLFAGCTAPGQHGNETPEPVVPAVATETPLPVPAATLPETTAPSITYATYTSSAHGLTIPYPADWQVQEMDEVALRDYGRMTTCFVTFRPPSDDPDAAISVDADVLWAKEIQDYFNAAVLAHQKYYGAGWDITKHNYQLKVSGIRSYRLDFIVPAITHEKSLFGVQFFTPVGKNVYIFRFRAHESAYNEYLDDIEEMIRKTRIEI
ncbi:MAG: hypothetical protein A4E35_00839 [Methanoregula sp. PtaU1.Bin051]|nr:MAG: hypothetical protein A4E35_00839 [Methanoregula sp. PtaU1.Bin051]